VRRCRECSGRRLAFASARAAVAYDLPVRRLVAAWKERGLRRLAVLAGELIADAVPQPDVQVLVAVPPDRDRTLRRGHSAAEALTRELGRRWELAYEPLLRRTRPLERQRGLDVSTRRRNVAGAFAAAAGVPRTVCLVDDVYTTGATVNAAASALRRAGARRVDVVTLARTLRVV
jgi:ComF family protein